MFALGSRRSLTSLAGAGIGPATVAARGFAATCATAATAGANANYPLEGLMQDRDLLISDLIRHAAEQHGDREISSRQEHTPDMFRYNYDAMHVRAKRLAHALQHKLGIKGSDRVATMAWNTHRHMEAWYGISGIGAVTHTINPRLFPDQITYIANHAEDVAVFVDPSTLPLAEKLAAHMPTIKHYIVMADAANMPTDSPLADRLVCYEDLIDGATDDFDWPTFPERTASSLCYTSGTTGNPKGVLYSHRSTVLHSFVVTAKDGIALGEADDLLVVVPLFHANAWGIPYASAMAGSRLVFPGPFLDGPNVYKMLNEERISLTFGVPSVWQMLFSYLDENPDINPRDLPLDRVIIGGSAPPRSMIKRFTDDFGAFVVHAWGMTETSPLGCVGALRKRHEGIAGDALLDLQQLQGRPVYGSEVAVTDDAGVRVPKDGTSTGNLMVRGPWIASGYYRHDEDVLENGWLPTGDVASQTADGFVQIRDRSKDLVKSGGEWISSIDVENAAMGVAGVAEAAVIAVPHSKWSERPLLIVRRKPGSKVGEAEIIAELANHVAKWWLPDETVFVEEELPKTATGKIQKLKLREMFPAFPSGEKNVSK